MFNTTMTRRALLRSTALVSAAAVFGCSTPAAIPAVVAQAAAIVENFGPALLNLVKAAGSLIPANVETEVQTWGTDLVNFAGQLAAAPTVAAGSSALVSIEGLANESLAALEAVPNLPAALANIIGDIKIALPIAEQVIGLVGRPKAMAMKASAPSGKTIADALAELAQAAGK